jgi:hypothetical protein
VSTQARTCRTLLVGLIAGSLLALAGPASQASAASGQVVHVRLNKAIKELRIARHRHAAAYDREQDFGDWIEQGGGCDTRAVVLKAESLKQTTQNSNCTIESGRWFSYYNATYYTSASSLQIDHTVPVENVWISGAWRWTKSTRVRYYNDLGDSRTLVAVDTHDNESKGDRDPSQWVPGRGKCRYLRSWTAVKLRWNLSVTRTELNSLSHLAGKCHNPKLTVRKASITYR